MDSNIKAKIIEPRPSILLPNFMTDMENEIARYLELVNNLSYELEKVSSFPSDKLGQPDVPTPINYEGRLKNIYILINYCNERLKDCLKHLSTIVE